MRFLKHLQNYCYVFSTAFLLIFSTSYSQEEIPREYRAEEFISFSRDITLDAALEIINQLSTKYENKIIIDPGEHKNKIGVVVDNMHWKRALEYILRSNLMKYVEHPRHYEIVPLSEQLDEDKPEELINHGTREVEIKAIFFEADQQALAEIGVDWTTISEGNVAVQLESKAGSNVASNLFSVAGKYSFGVWNVKSLIKTFESYNKGRVLATPQIRIMEGQEGKIKVGKNFFLTTRDFAGNTRYQEYESGTILTVIPQIITKGKLSFIHLRILAEKSDVVPSDVGVTKKITEGRTEVLLLNGEETAIAGLFSNEEVHVRKGIPILKDLPWWFFGLKYVFGYNSRQITKKELIILIKVEIVPSIVTRLKSKILRQNHLRDRKKDFEERIKQFKNY